MARLHKYTAMGAGVWCNLPLPGSFPWKEHGSRASQACAEGEQPRGSFSQAVAACQAPSLLVTAASSVTLHRDRSPVPVGRFAADGGYELGVTPAVRDHPARSKPGEGAAESPEGQGADGRGA